MSIKILKQFIIFAQEFSIELTAENLKKFRRIFNNEHKN